MDKKDALIVQILAQASTKNSATNRITAPDELEASVRKVYREAEEQLQSIPVPAAVMRGRGFQKMLTWIPDRGLMVHDTGPSGSFPHWSEESCQMLLTTLSLIPELLDKAHQNHTRAKASNLSAGAEAVIAGVDIEILPQPKPDTRPITKEEDMPRVSVVQEEIEEEEEDSDEVLLEDLLEEEPQEDESREILGVSGVVEEAEETTLPDIDEFIAPARKKREKKK